MPLSVRRKRQIHTVTGPLAKCPRAAASPDLANFTNDDGSIPVPSPAQTPSSLPTTSLAVRAHGYQPSHSGAYYVAIVSRFRYTIAMSRKLLARNVLWEVATVQHGFVTAQQAAELGITRASLQMMAQRGTLDRAAFGVYRFPQYPVGEHDQKMLGVLWTRLPEAAISHETALEAYGISDVNPNRIHVTVGKGRRLRRTGGDQYVVHYEDLTPKQIGWWQEIPTVTAKTAIEQCLEYGTPTYLLRQSIHRGHAQGYLKTTERDELAAALEAKYER